MNKRFDWNGRILKVCYFGAWKSCPFLCGLSAILNYSVPDWRDLVKGETLMNWECKMHFVSFFLPSFPVNAQNLYCGSLLVTEVETVTSSSRGRVEGRGRERSEVENEDKDEWNFLFPSLPPPLSLPSPLPSFHERSVLKCLSYTRSSTTLYKWSEKNLLRNKCSGKAINL